MEYQEIFKLKRMLTKAKIPFEYCNRSSRSKHDVLNVELYQICCPNASDDRYISVIEGLGTYGSDKDLLEIMGCMTEEELKNDSVLGWLTAEEVFERILKHEKENENGRNDL